MNRIIITLVLSLLISSVCAQNGDKRRILIIHSGLSVPFSDFSGTRIGYNPGFAGEGFNAEADYLRYLGRFFGIMATTGYTKLDFRENAYRSEYMRILGQDSEITVNSGNYQIYKAIMGLAVRTPEFKHFELVFILHLGCAFFIHPEIKVDLSGFGRINTIQKDVNLGNINIYSFKLNYYPSARYGINLSYNLNYAKPWFTDETGIHNRYQLPVEFQNINLGLIVRL
jgi:hypothetical protein